MNPFTALENLSPFHFTFFFPFLLSLSLSLPPPTYPIHPSLHFTLLFTSTTRFPSLHFPSFHFPSLFTFYCLHFPHCFTLQWWNSIRETRSVFAEVTLLIITFFWIANFQYCRHRRPVLELMVNHSIANQTLTTYFPKMQFHFIFTFLSFCANLVHSSGLFTSVNGFLLFWTVRLWNLIALEVSIKFVLNTLEAVNWRFVVAIKAFLWFRASGLA